MGSACTKAAKATATVSPAPQRQQNAAPSLQRASQVGHRSKRRGSVSAEPSGGRSSLPPNRQSIAKLSQSTQKIRELVRSTLLFKELDEEQEAGIIDAMFERRVVAGEVVIREGEEADNFYVIEKGNFAATKRGANGGEPVQVASYEGHGAFGELALMYNCPRAATVTALTDGVLWGVDRATFRSLVVRSMEEKRQRYEQALQSMPILQDLTQGQLAAVADCLHQETFQDGEYILREGAPLDEGAKFYMIESGEVECFRTIEGKKKAVTTLQAGDVFGEVALLTKAPRQADCVASSQVKCLTMGRDAFERLMGPAEQVLSQQIAQYAQQNKEQQEAAAAASASEGEGGGSATASQEAEQAAASAEERLAGDVAEKDVAPAGPEGGSAAGQASSSVVEERIVPAEVEEEEQKDGQAAAELEGVPPAKQVSSGRAQLADMAAVPAVGEMASQGTGHEAGTAPCTGEGGDAADEAEVPVAATIPGAAAAPVSRAPSSAPGSPASAPGSPSYTSAAALLPGSPRPPLRLSDNNSFSRPRSGTPIPLSGLSAGHSMRGSASGSEVESGSFSASPTALLGNLSQTPPQQQQQVEGGAGGGKPTSPTALDAGVLVAAEAGEEGPAICTLPSIAEEPAESALTRRGSTGKSRTGRGFPAPPTSGSRLSGAAAAKLSSKPSSKPVSKKLGAVPAEKPRKNSTGAAAAR